LANDNRIRLFVMHGCQVCPQMERVFRTLLAQGDIAGLDVIDLGEEPQQAQKYAIRSVPYYLIGEVGFNGLKSAGEIKRLLQLGESGGWQDRLSEDFRQGDLAQAERDIRQHPTAQRAMIALLESPQTELLVRIGLTAVIESLASEGALNVLEEAFIGLADSTDKRIATDALYYLQLQASAAAVKKLREVAQGDDSTLAAEARDLLDELASSEFSA
jgi:hypothetical protein